MTSDFGGSRAERRKQQKRRRNIVIASLVGALAVAGIVVALILIVTREDDTPSGAVTQTRRTSTTSSTTTPTTTAPDVPATPVPASENPVVALAQQYDGRYVGAFSNTTFGTQGPAILELRIDPATAEIKIDAEFDGDLFGGGAKEVRKISGTVAIGDPNAAVTTQTEKFGPVTGRIDETLALVLTAEDVPDPKVKSFTLTGRLRADNTGFDATYTVVFEDGTTAEGNVTVTCDPQGVRPSEVTTVCALTAPQPG